jgi:S1-C subfamily serine protease
MHLFEMLKCIQSTRVTFYTENGSSTSFEASIAGTDPSRDLAVLNTAAPPELLRPIKIGTSADLRIGQFVFAIGNPSGLSRSQTCGIVSGLNRSIPSPTGIRIPGVIQTDAPINAGALQLVALRTENADAELAMFSSRVSAAR